MTEPGPLRVGEIYETPDGKLVEINGGSYMGHHGVSNHFYWREVLEDGTLGEQECGYGWMGTPSKAYRAMKRIERKQKFNKIRDEGGE